MLECQEITGAAIVENIATMTEDKKILKSYVSQLRRSTMSLPVRIACEYRSWTKRTVDSFDNDTKKKNLIFLLLSVESSTIDVAANFEEFSNQKTFLRILRETT